MDRKKTMANNKRIVMLGTRYDTMGGISAVVNVYRAAGLFERFSIQYLTTHCDGSAASKIRILLRALATFFSLLIMGRIGLMHVHMSSRASFWRKCLFVLPAFALRVPTIIHLHGSEFAVFYEKECNSLSKRFVRFVFNSASRIVVLSSAWQEWVSGMCTNPKVEAVYNPVLVPEQPSPWSARSNGEVLFLGRLGKRKGSYDLVDAAAQLHASNDQFRLLMGGDGDVKEISARATSLGMGDNVKLLGWVRGLDKEQYLSSARIYVLPSYHEGLPMSVLEAMAAGLPVISTPIGGIPEAVSDGVEGFLVPPGDIEMLADRLERLLNDDELAKRMGAAARDKVVTTFSADAVLPRVEQIYNELGFNPI
jgi:glycosyltransferase involved in cell wall biosynthesis